MWPSRKAWEPLSKRHQSLHQSFRPHVWQSYINVKSKCCTFLVRPALVDVRKLILRGLLDFYQHLDQHFFEKCKAQPLTALALAPCFPLSLPGSTAVFCLSKKPPEEWSITFQWLWLLHFLFSVLCWHSQCLKAWSWVYCVLETLIPGKKTRSLKMHLPEAQF